MASKASMCAQRLSEGEQASLRKLCSGARSRDIPNEHAEKLLDLGLAEVHCGDLGPTGAGRVALRSSDLIEYTDELQDYSMLDLATAELYLSCWNRKGGN